MFLCCRRTLCEITALGVQSAVLGFGQQFTSRRVELQRDFVLWCALSDRVVRPTTIVLFGIFFFFVGFFLVLPVLIFARFGSLLTVAVVSVTVSSTSIPEQPFAEPATAVARSLWRRATRGRTTRVNYRIGD
jgi:hypothetical protein